MRKSTNIVEAELEQDKLWNSSWENIFEDETSETKHDSIRQEMEQDKALRLRQAIDMVDKLNSNAFDDEKYYRLFLVGVSRNIDNYIKYSMDIELKAIKFLLNKLDQNFEPSDEDINFIVEEYIKDLKVDIFDEKRYENKKNNFCKRFWDKIWEDLLKYGVFCGKWNEYLFKRLRIEDWIQKRKKYKGEKDIDDIKKRYDASEFLPSNIKQRNVILDYNIISKWHLSYMPPESYEIKSTWTIDENHIQYTNYDVVNTEDIVWSRAMTDCRKWFIDWNIWGAHNVEVSGLLDSMKEEWFVFDQWKRPVQLNKYLWFNGKPLYFVTVDWNHRVAVAKSLNIPKIVAKIEDYSIGSDREKVKWTRDEKLVNDWRYRISKWYIDWKIIKDWWEYILKYTKWCFDGCCMSKEDLARYVKEYQKNIWEIDGKNMAIIQDMLNN